MAWLEDLNLSCFPISHYKYKTWHNIIVGHRTTRYFVMNSYWLTELSGQVRCQMCNGYGFRTQSEQRERCINCSLSRHGRGRQDCSECDAKGKLACSVCDSYGQILCYIRLTVTWLVTSCVLLKNFLQLHVHYTPI